MSVELKARFFGRVQGVGFRYTVKQLADALLLPGTVENLPDGSVSLLAQGEMQHLKLLLSRIEKEFESYIEGRDVEYLAIQDPLQGFLIKKR